MQANTYRVIRSSSGQLVMGAILLLFCANFAQAEFGTGAQLMPLLPVTAGTSAQPAAVSQQESGVNFLLELVPLWYLYSPDMDGFKVQRTGPWTWESEEIEGWGSLLPNLRAGIRINTSRVNFDITGGGGYLWNGAVSAPFIVGDFAANFRVGKYVTIGPHIGVISFDELEWSEDADIDFSDSTGLMAGCAFTTGGRKVSFYLAVDYVDAEFDVERTGSGWSANRNELDMSGVAVQVGVLFRF